MSKTCLKKKMFNFYSRYLAFCLGLENIPQDAFIRIEKDKDLQVEIQNTKFAYAKQMKLAWDGTY
jgi:hypothetical protein